MGYFKLLEELDADARRQADEAASLAASASEDWSGALDVAWARVDEPAFIGTLFEALADLNPETALARARVVAAATGSAEETRVLMEEGIGSAGPLLTSLLFTDRKEGAARLIAAVYSKYDRSIAQHLEALASGSEATSFFALLALSTSPIESDRALAGNLTAESALPEAWLESLRIQIALSGTEGDSTWLVNQLTSQVTDTAADIEQAVASGRKRHVRREENSVVAELCRAAGKLRLAEAVPGLLGLLYTFDALEALDALGAIGDERALEPIRKYRSTLAGDPSETLPFRLAADNALRSLGDDISTDSARTTFDAMYPRRYGYPKTEHCIAHWTRAITAYADGSDEELGFACDYVGAPWHGMRQAASVAWEKVHGAPPELDYWDKTRIGQVAEADGSETLVEALKNPTSVYRHLVVAHLMEHPDEEVRRSTAAWVVKHVEGRRNYFVDRLDQMPDDLKTMLRAIRDADDDFTEMLEASSSGWIHALLLDGDAIPKPSIYSAPADPPEVEISAHGTAPFVYGKHINGLAVSHDGTKLAVVGESFGRLDNLASGEEHAYLDLRWNWGYDCEFSPDDTMLAACFHGGHVELYDAETGKQLFDELEGHSGVPNGVKRLAFSPDGSSLVTVGQDARVICWDTATGEQLWSHQGPAGSYEAVTWSPDGSQVVASHCKTSGGERNFLTVHDASTGDATEHPMKRSIWALRYSPDGEQLAMGGEASVAVLCDPADFSVTRELEMTGVTGLEFSPDGSLLYGCSSEGLLTVWETASEQPEGTHLLEGSGPLWALNVAGDGTVRTIGTKGMLHTFVDGEPVQELPAVVHSKQIKGFAIDGSTLLTASWDGQLLRWPLEGGSAEVVYQQSKRFNRMAMQDGKVAVAGGEGLRVIDLATHEVERETEGDLDAVAFSADGRSIAIDAREVLQVLAGDEVTAVTVGSDSISRIAATPDGAWLAGTDAGELSLVRDGERVWTIADHGADRLQFGAPHKDICDILVFDGGFATAGNDNTVRVYDWPGGNARPQIRLRIHTYSGIFNGLSASPDARLLALPSSGSLQIYDLATGATVLSLPTLDHFGHSPLTVPHFVDNDSLWVGTETGRFFLVRIGGTQ